MRFAALGFVVSTVLVGSAAPLPDQPWFRADTLEIQPGGSAKLSWRWDAAVAGYLSTVGSVDHPSGDTVSVSPNESSTYILILEAPGIAPRILTQRLVVRGSKGSAGVWPPDLFAPLAYQQNYEKTFASLAALAAKVRKVLRDDQHFEFQEFGEADQMVFATAFLQSSRLNDPNENPRRIRRLAYRIALAPAGTSPPAGTSRQIHVNLSLSIQWRIVVDPRWFTEDSSSSDRYATQIADLWKALQGK